VDQLRALEWNPTAQWAGPAESNISMPDILRQFQLQQQQIRASNFQDVLDPQQRLLQQLLSNVSPSGHRQPQRGYSFSAQPAASTDFVSRISLQQEDYLRSSLQAALQTQQRLESTADISALADDALRRQPTHEHLLLRSQGQAGIFHGLPHPAEQHHDALRNLLSGTYGDQWDNPLSAMLDRSSQLDTPPSGPSQQYDLQQGEQSLIGDPLFRAAFANAIGSRSQTGINRLVHSPPSSQPTGASIADYIRESQLRSMLATETFRQHSLLTPASDGPITTSLLPASAFVDQNALQYLQDPSMSGQASLARDDHIEDDRKPRARTSQDDTKSSSSSSSSSDEATRKRRRAD
jgi:hypothetical protein